MAEAPLKPEKDFSKEVDKLLSEDCEQVDKVGSSGRYRAPAGLPQLTRCAIR